MHFEVLRSWQPTLKTDNFHLTRKVWNSCTIHFQDMIHGISWDPFYSCCGSLKIWKGATRSHADGGLKGGLGWWGPMKRLSFRKVTFAKHMKSKEKVPFAYFLLWFFQRLNRFPKPAKRFIPTSSKASCWSFVDKRICKSKRFHRSRTANWDCWMIVFCCSALWGNLWCLWNDRMI